MKNQRTLGRSRLAVVSFWTAICCMRDGAARPGQILVFLSFMTEPGPAAPLFLLPRTDLTAG